MKNLRSIEVKFLQATNTKPTRIKFTENRWNNKIGSKIMTFNKYTDDSDFIVDIANKILTKNGFNVVASSECKDHFLMLCDNWGENWIDLNDIK